MPFVVFHLNEPGRPPSRVAVAVEHIISIREVADDAGTEIKLSDGTLVNVTEQYGTIMEDLARIGLSPGADYSIRDKVSCSGYSYGLPFIASGVIRPFAWTALRSHPLFARRPSCLSASASRSS